MTAGEKVDWPHTSKSSKDNKVKSKHFSDECFALVPFLLTLSCFFRRRSYWWQYLQFLLGMIVMPRFRLKIGQKVFQKIDDFFNFTLLESQFGIFIFVSTR